MTPLTADQMKNLTIGDLVAEMDKTSKRIAVYEHQIRLKEALSEISNARRRHLLQTDPKKLTEYWDYVIAAHDNMLDEIDKLSELADMFD